MSAPPPRAAGPDPVSAALVLADRLRGLPESRLGRSAGPTGEPLWSLARVLAQAFADAAAARIDPATDPVRPDDRQVPDLGPFVVADQLTVTATELRTVLDLRSGSDHLGPVGPAEDAALAALARATAELAAHLR